MPFLGKTPTVGNFILLDSITVSNTATFALTKDSLDYYPGSAQNMIVSVNGVTQAPLTAYTITDNNIVFASALDSDTDVIDYILVLGDTLNIGRPSDSTVGATQLQDYAVTSVKMSNTGVGAATYGTSTSIPQITIDAAGRITSATGIDRSNQFEDLTVTGNLTVSGNTVTVDAQTLSVEDPLIHLAANNETSDVVDIGFVGHYSNDGGTTKLHTGFFRDASDEKYYLFNGFEDNTLDLSSPSTTIDRTANTFTLAHLNVGGLNANGIFTIGDRGTATEELTIFHEDNVSYLISDSSAGGGAKGEFSFRTNDGGTAAERVRIDGDGNVGIGETSPQAKLDVSSGATLQQATYNGQMKVGVYSTTGDTDSGVEWQVRTDGAGYGFRAINIHAGGGNQWRLQSRDNSASWTDNIVVDQGNVAIGNTNATYILDVDVGAPSSSDQVLGRFSSQNGIRDVGFVWDDSNSTLGVATLTNHALSFHTNGNSSERMRITSTGSVRIDPNGTTSGLSTLGITTNAMTIGDLSTFNLAFDSNELQARNNGASNNLILNKHGGTVAIGAAETTGGLYVTSAQNRTIILDGTFSSGSFTWQSVRRSGTEKYRWFINNDDSMSLYSDAGSTYAQTWLTNGKVGIGTLTPTDKLNVDVNTAASAVDSISIQNSGVTTAGHTAGLRFQYNTAVPAAIRAELRNTSSGAGELNFYTSSTGSAANLAQHLSIQSDGIIDQQGLQKKVYTVPSPGSGVTRVWELIDPSLASRQFGIITLLCGRSGLRQQRIYHRYYFNSSDYDNAAAMTTIETPLTAGFSTASVTYSNNKIYLTLTGDTNAITDAFRVIIEGVFVDHLDPSTYTQT